MTSPHWSGTRTSETAVYFSPAAKPPVLLLLGSRFFLEGPLFPPTGREAEWNLPLVGCPQNGYLRHVPAASVTGYGDSEISWDSSSSHPWVYSLQPEEGTDLVRPDFRDHHPCPSANHTEALYKLTTAYCDTGCWTF